MAKYVIGKKLGMMQVFDPDKKTARAVTVIDVGPMKVTNLKTAEKDGYTAVQIGYGVKKRVGKATQGRVKGIGNFAHFRELRIAAADLAQYEKGKPVGLEQFSAGDMVSVIGITKGRGFAGVVKRHGFAGGPKSHGQKHGLRAPGSIGGGGRAGGKVAKGLRMAGHMGSVRVTVKKLTVVDVDQDKSILLVSGAVPGYNGSWVEVKS